MTYFPNSAGGASVTTTTTDPDSTDASNNVGDLWINTNTGKSFLCVDATASAAVWVPQSGLRPHDSTIHSPLAQWDFDGVLTDSSGNGLTLTRVNGSGDFYQSLGPGLPAIYMDGTQFYRETTGDASLQLTGAMTFLAFVQPHFSAAKVMLSHAPASQSVAADNQLYYLQTTGADNELRYGSESGTLTWEPLDFAGGIAEGKPSHVAFVRDADGDVSLYLDGELMGAQVSGTSPTSGTSGRLTLGASNAGSAVFVGLMASVKIIGSELTAAQVRNEMLRTGWKG